jgi:hypothetical protein
MVLRYNRENMLEARPATDSRAILTYYCKKTSFAWLDFPVGSLSDGLKSGAAKARLQHMHQRTTSPKPWQKEVMTRK